MRAPPMPAAIGTRHERWELADIVRRYGLSYRATHRLSRIQRRALRAVAQCRTAALGGHLEQCASCQRTRPVYNSCLMGSLSFWRVRR